MLSFGVAGVTILALAGILAATGIFLSQIRSLGVLTTYDARTRLYLGIAAIAAALTLLCGTTAARAVRTWHPSKD